MTHESTVVFASANKIGQDRWKKERWTTKCIFQALITNPFSNEVFFIVDHPATVCICNFFLIKKWKKKNGMNTQSNTSPEQRTLQNVNN